MNKKIPSEGCLRLKMPPDIRHMVRIVMSNHPSYGERAGQTGEFHAARQQPNITACLNDAFAMGRG